MRRRLSKIVGARLIKTGLAVSLSTGIMSYFDPTHGLVGAGVSAAIMIAPDDKVSKEWGRNQFMAAALGALLGLVIGHFIGWAPWLSGIAAMLLISLYARTGYSAAIVGGLGNCLFILEHTDRGSEYALFRFTASMVGLVIGYLVNRYVLPYRRPAAQPTQEKLAEDELDLAVGD
ncbi:MAG TPA: aromatic acid exporter family protein [Symbiobacteriaceae bacterium]|nr:aromatic acid exporter family protein [Symbiobacteriaceae bacterium]